MESELKVVERHLSHAPVDLAAAFGELGIRYAEQPIHTGESGWIERDNDEYQIVVNSQEPEPRRRFTAAHELAHYLLHRDLMNHGSKMNRHTDRLFDDRHANEESPFKPYHEVQANRLAARIVMPAALVKKWHATGLDTVQLAEKFRVSRAAMAIRLETLGLAPN